MIRNILFCLLAAGIISCGENAEKELTTPSGYVYTINGAGNTTKAVGGDFVGFELKITGSDGEVLQDIPEGPNMPVLQLPTPENPLPQANPILEALEGAAIGDTVTLRMSMDSLPQAKANPQFQHLTYIEYKAVVAKIQDEKTKKAEDEALRLEMEAKAEEARKRIPEIDAMLAQTLKDYKSGKLKTEKHESGLRYVIHEEGDGVQAENDMMVSVDYYGITTDGKNFDNSYKRGAPYTFPLGKGQVIKGWDIGIGLLKKGGKATLFIPYELGYGEAGNPPSIGPKAELLFYVELVDAK